MVDHRITIIRDAMLKTHGLHLADSEIRTLLVAIDAIGVPLPCAQTVRLGYDGDDFPEPGFELRLPPFDGVEEAQFALGATR